MNNLAIKEGENGNGAEARKLFKKITSIEKEISNGSSNNVDIVSNLTLPSQIRTKLFIDESPLYPA